MTGGFHRRQRLTVEDQARIWGFYKSWVLTGFCTKQIVLKRFRISMTQLQRIIALFNA